MQNHQVHMGTPYEVFHGPYIAIVLVYFLRTGNTRKLKGQLLQDIQGDVVCHR